MCHLPVVHEAQHGLEFRVSDALEVEQRMLVGIPPQHIFEEGGAGGEDHLVGGDLLLAFSARQRHVKEVLVLPDLPEGHADVTFEIIPLQTELLGRHFEGLKT